MAADLGRVACKLPGSRGWHDLPQPLQRSLDSDRKEGRTRKRTGATGRRCAMFRQRQDMPVAGEEGVYVPGLSGKRIRGQWV